MLNGTGITVLVIFMIKSSLLRGQVVKYVSTRSCKACVESYGDGDPGFDETQGRFTGLKSYAHKYSNLVSICIELFQKK